MSAEWVIRRINRILSVDCVNSSNVLDIGLLVAGEVNPRSQGRNAMLFSGTEISLIDA